MMILPRGPKFIVRRFWPVGVPDFEPEPTELKIILSVDESGKHFGAEQRRHFRRIESSAEHVVRSSVAQIDCDCRSDCFYIDELGPGERGTAEEEERGRKMDDAGKLAAQGDQYPSWRRAGSDPR